MNKRELIVEIEKTIERLVGKYSHNNDKELLKLELERLVILGRQEGVNEAFERIEEAKNDI